MKLLLAKLCYVLGDIVSRFVFHIYGFGWLYPVYSKLMIWSDTLDEGGVIWGKAEETETE